jgi:hypothetical protein
MASHTPPAGARPQPAPLQQRLRARLHNPLLRTLTIVAIELLPDGPAYWAPETERVAVLTLAPGLCGYDTACRLSRGARAELARALAELCAARVVLLRPASPRQARASSARAPRDNRQAVS